MRFALLALSFWTVFGAAAAYADDRPFTRADYESYFAPGRFSTYSPFYESHGTLEMVSRKGSEVSGKHVVEQSTKSFDVSVNYDGLSKYEFYKIETIHTDMMEWDPHRNLYVYDYTKAEFLQATSMVWESHDNRMQITAGDKAQGELQQFYRDADKRAGRNVRGQEDDFLRQVIGAWTWSCSFVNKNGFDVECRSTHQSSGRTETYFFHKLDLIG